VSTGNQILRIRFLPTHAVNSVLGLRVATAIDQNPDKISSIDTKEFGSNWSMNVLQGFAEIAIPHSALGKGEITLRISLLEPGVVLTSLSVLPADPGKSSK
jgi:hypothetical protein